LVVVRGPAGIGKTALVSAVRRLASDRQMTVLSARGELLERDYAFGIAHQLLAGPATARLAAGKLTGAAALTRAPLGLDQDKRPPRVSDPFAARHGLYWLAADLAAEHPALLALDDAQWADAPSAEWLAFLARRLDEVPLSLVIAVRDEDEPGLALAALVADPSRLTVRPHPLSREAVAEVAAGVLGQRGEAIAETVYDATEGNPLWVNEVLRALAAEASSGMSTAPDMTPASVRRAVLVRLGQLAAGSVDLARAVAVLGLDVDIVTAAVVANLDRPEADRAARALVQAGVLVETEVGLSFSHPVVREAVYADQGAGGRATGHEAAARVLGARGADAERVATHLLRVPPGRESWITERLCQAADLALARGAPEVAVEYLQRGLGEEGGEDHAAILHKLGIAEGRLNEPGAAQHLLAAYRLATPGRRPMIAVEAAHSLSMGLRVDEAVALLEEALAEVPSSDQEHRLQLSAELVATRLFLGEVSDPPDQLPEGKTAGARAFLAIWSLVRMARAGPMDEAVRMARAAWGEGRLLAEEGPDSTYVQFVIGAVSPGDSYAEPLSWLDEVLGEARRRGSVTAHVLALSLRAYTYIRRGDIGEAAADARLAVEAEAAHPNTIFTPFSLMSLIEALIETGDLAEADEALRARGLDGPIPDLYTVNILLDRRGRLRIAQGRLEEGVADILEARRRLDWFTNPIGNMRSHAAIGLLALDRADEARALVAEERELAHRVGVLRQIAIAERVAALTDQPVDLEGLERSAEMAATAGARLEQARALADLGAAVRRTGQRVRARRILHQALELATRCGATVLAERAHEELLAAGGRVRHVSLSGADSLTPSERRVARLAAEGRTNREIAQGLFLTVRTIEMHLSNAYGKLEISSRGELTEALASSDSSERPVES
jgi:DNA-binding CsgD family transcriptional regulator